jgi:hypothetical protein
MLKEKWIGFLLHAPMFVYDLLAERRVNITHLNTRIKSKYNLQASLQQDHP